MLKSSVGLFDWEEFAHLHRAVIEQCDQRCQTAIKKAQARTLSLDVEPRFSGLPEFQKLRQLRHSRPRKHQYSE
jgi:hypothetical protein